MRKIELEMIGAIKSRKNWMNSNTEVSFHDGQCLGIGKVRLHGNVIAIIHEDRISADYDTLREYPTRTTCSRLRALGIPVSVKQGIPHIDGVAV